MVILDEKLYKYLKKQNFINWMIILCCSVFYILIAFLLIYFQSREYANIFMVSASILTCVYVFFIWMLIYSSIIPITNYKKIIVSFLSNPSRQHLTLQYIETQSALTTIRRIRCKSLVFNIVGEDKNITFCVEKDVDLNLKENDIYEIYYYQQFIGEIKKSESGI